MLSKRFRNNRKAVLGLNSLQQRIKTTIEAEINDGTYSFESIPCYICEKNDFGLLAEKDRYGLYCPVVICKNCGLIQQNPRMGQQAYHHFYEEEYRKLYVGEKIPTCDFLGAQYERGKSIYRYLKSNLHVELVNLRVAEIGTGAGGILKYFKERGNIVFGLDMDPDYINFGKKKYGLNLEVGTLATIKLPWVPDIVIYSHVIEHLMNPMAELVKLKFFISEGTFIYIETPGIRQLHYNYGADFLKLLQNAHTYYFTLTTLQNLLKKACYDFVCGDEFIHAIFKLSPNKPVKLGSNMEFEEDFQNILAFLKRMEWYRFLPTVHNISFNIKPALVSLLKTFGIYNFSKSFYFWLKH